MSGQNKAMLASKETLGAIRDTLETSLFEVSTLAGETLPAVGGLNFMQRALMTPPGWVYLYLLMLLGLFVWIRHFYGNIFIQTIQAAM